MLRRFHTPPQQQTTKIVRTVSLRFCSSSSSLTSPINQTSLLQQKFKNDFIELCNKFSSSTTEGATNNQFDLIESMTKHIHFASRSLGNSSSSSLSSFFINNHQQNDVVVSDLKVIRNVFDTFSSSASMKNKGSSGGGGGDTELMLMLANIVADVLTNERIKFKSSSSSTTEKIKIAKILHHSISIANSLRKCKLDCSSHSPVQSLVTSILLLLHEVTIKNMSNDNFFTMMLNKDENEYSKNVNRLKGTIIDKRYESLLQTFGRDKLQQEHNISILLRIVGCDWLKVYDQSRERDSEQAMLLPPELVLSLHSFFLVTSVAWERQKMERFYHHKNSGNNITRNNNNNNKQPSPPLIFENLLLFTSNLFRFNIWLSKNKNSSNNGGIAAKNTSSNFSHKRSQHQQQIEDRSRLLFARYVICSACTTVNKITNSNRDEDEQEQGKRRKQNDILDNRIFEQNQQTLSRFGYLIGASQLMNSSLLDGISKMYFKYFLVPVRKMRDHDQGDSSNNNNNTTRRTYSSSFVLDEKDANSIKRSIDIMKHKLRSTGLAKRKYALLDVTVDDLVRLMNYKVERVTNQINGMTTGKHVKFLESHHHQKNNTEENNNHHDDAFAPMGEEENEHDDNIVNISNSSSKTTTVFPSIDPKRVVIMKQVDLRRSSINASWGLLVNPIGMISVPLHMMSRTNKHPQNDIRDKNVQSSATSSFKNSFFEEIVAPTRELGCKLRLMAIDNKPVNSMDQVKERLENVVKVRLTVCVVRSED